MFKYAVICIVFFVAIAEGFISSRFRINTKCEQPRGDVCLPIRECQYFADLLERSTIPRPRHVIKVIRERQCGFQGNTPKVCCNLPPPPKLPPTEVLEVDEIVAHYPPDVTNHPNMKLLPKECGNIAPNFRITGGSSASLFEFPWMALIVYNTEQGLDFRCGGTLINERYVLTAAHCISNYSIQGVRLGEYNVKTQEDCDPNNQALCSPPVQDFSIESIAIHKKYNPKYFTDDIALIRLAAPADFKKENVQPICLPIGELRNMDLNGKYVTIAGWGVTETGYKSKELQKAIIPIVSNAECVSIYGRLSKLSGKQICAGGSMGKDSCGGDSGGPLKYVGLINSTSRYVQFGIVSYGPRHCGAEKQPGVYTRVSSYMQWILDNMRL